MKRYNQLPAAGALVALGLGVLLSSGYLGGKPAFAQSSSSQGSGAGGAEGQIDEYQRSAQVYYLQRMGKEGKERGQELYIMKCLICHNDYAIEADPKSAGPTLRDLYKRPKLISGKAVNDQTVKEKIREGGPQMPSYRYGLSDKDLSDLVSYLREKCCWDGLNPPANPRYRAH